MKLTLSQQKKLHKKLRVNASAENVFVHMYMEDVKKIIGDKIKKATSYEEVEQIINSINVRKLKKYIKNLKNGVLKRNDHGFGHVIEAVTSGIKQIKNKYKQEKQFAVAVPKLIKEKKIYEPLMEKFEHNMSLIKDLPKDVYNQLKKGYLQGKSFRGSEVEKILYERMGNRAKLIVRTESSKVNAALTEVRARTIGIKAYIWSSSEDQRVRETHKLMNKSLVFWNDAPELDGMGPAGCGEYPNCRCVSLPIFEISDIQFPVRVAEHVKIKSVRVGKGKYKAQIISGRFAKYNKREFLLKYGQVFLSHDELTKMIENS